MDGDTVAERDEPVCQLMANDAGADRDEDEETKEIPTQSISGPEVGHPEHRQKEARMRLDIDIPDGHEPHRSPQGRLCPLTRSAQLLVVDGLYRSHRILHARLTRIKNMIANVKQETSFPALSLVVEAELCQKEANS